jgi:hypothetical protein
MDRYSVDFLDIQCTPLPKQERAEFLSEVQYLANMPNRVRILDDQLVPRLADAFAHHPWVEKVERVQVTPQPAVQVQLTLRRAVLAVSDGNQLRAVDRNGVLLPATAITCGLPLFAGQARAAAGPAGTSWGDAAVEDAARGRLSNVFVTGIPH